MHYHIETHISEVNLFLFSFGGGTTISSFYYVLFWFQVVGVDRKNGCKLMSFQELSSRGRGSRDASITLDSIKVYKLL